MGSCSVTRFVRAVILASVVLSPCEVSCAWGTDSTLIARGKVADQRGKPISNARVMIFAANGREYLPSTFCEDCTVLESATDDDGMFQFAIRTNDKRFLHYGDVKILVVADGFETQVRKFPLSRLLVDLPFEFSLANAIPIRLRLLDPSGNPVANTTIAPARIVKYRLNYHVAQRISQQTDSNGFVVLEHYRPNTMPQIYVTSKRYGKQQIELREIEGKIFVAQLMPNVELRCHLTLPPNLDADSAKGLRFRLVTYQINRFILEGPATVSWQHVEVDAKGQFVANRICPGTVFLELLSNERFGSKHDYPESLHLVAENSPLDIEFETVESRQITFSVVDEDGNGLPNICLGDSISDSNGVVSGYLPSNGKADGQRFPADALKRHLVVSPFGVSLDKLKRDIEGNFEPIVMVEAKTVSGTVVDSNGMPLRSATVTYSYSLERFNQIESVLSDRYGNFDIIGVPPDTPIKIKAAKNNWMTDDKKPTQLVANHQQSVELVLYEKTARFIVGNVVDQNETPIEGVKVVLQKAIVRIQEGYGGEELKPVPVYEHLPHVLTDESGQFVFPQTIDFDQRLQVKIEDANYFTFRTRFIDGKKRGNNGGPLDLGTFRLLKRPLYKKTQLSVFNLETGNPIPSAEFVFIGVHTGKEIVSTDRTGQATIELADASQLVGIKANGFAIHLQTIERVAGNLKFGLTPESRNSTHERLEWFRRQGSVNEQVASDLLGDLTLPAPKQSTFYRQFLYFQALARSDWKRFVRIMSREGDNYEYREDFLSWTINSIFLAEPILAAQMTLDDIVDMQIKSATLAQFAFQVDPSGFRSELFGEAIVASRNTTGPELLRSVGSIAKYLVLDHRIEEAKQLIQQAWDGKSADEMKALLRSKEPEEHLALSRVFCPCLAIVAPKAAFELIELTASKSEIESLKDEALFLVSLCDWEQFSRLLDQRNRELEYLDRVVFFQLNLLSNQRISHYRNWLVQLVDRVSKPEPRLQLWLLAARGSKNPAHRREALVKANEAIELIPPPEVEHYFWDPGRHVLNAVMSMPDIEKARLDELIFSLMRRAPAQFDEHGSLAILSNLVRILAISDSDLARKTIEPAIEHNEWLFHERNHAGFLRNYVLRSTLWIDPVWAVEETRKLSSELSSDNAVRPLELRAGMIEDVEIISGALRKASSSRLEK